MPIEHRFQGEVDPSHGFSELAGPRAQISERSCPVARIFRISWTLGHGFQNMIDPRTRISEFWISVRLQGMVGPGGTNFKNENVVDPGHGFQSSLTPGTDFRANLARGTKRHGFQNTMPLEHVVDSGAQVSE